MRSLNELRLRQGCYRLIALILAAPMAAGCTRHVYEIDLTPRGREIERTLAASGAGQSSSGERTQLPLPRDEVSRLEEAYGQRAVQEDGQTRLSRTLTDQMPQDVGGAGSYTHWETSLGDLSFYVERFRGGTDLLAMMKDRLEAADMAVDFIWSFVEAEADDSPAGKRLRDFVDHELRRDARNATLLVWAMEISQQEMQAETLRDAALVRLLQFLLEREYVTLDAAATLSQVEFPMSVQVFDLIQQLLARKLVLSKAELLRALPPLNSREELRAAFNSAVADCNAYRAWLAQLPEDAPFDAKAPDAPADALLTTILAAAGSPLSEHDQVIVRLHPPQPPFSTNGQISDDGTVQWSGHVELPDDPPINALPTLCYAAWSEPSTEFQTSHFGKVLLEGRPLGEYISWRRGLDEVHGREWDAFVASLTTDDDLTARLTGFRFSTTPDDVERDDRLIEVQKLLLAPPDGR